MPTSAEGVNPMDAQLQRMWDDSFDRQRLRSAIPTFGVHPDDVITMLRYAPLGLTHLTWRNTVLEDWHAGGRIDDPDMFRANADTTLIFHEALWAIFGEQIGYGNLVALDDVADEVSVEMFEDALIDAYATAFDPDRTLPNGLTLAQLAQDELAVLQHHATTQVGALIEKAEEPGVDVVLLYLAARGAGACSRWWGSPHWPAQVDRFVDLLNDAAHNWWQHREFPAQRPLEVADLARLRYLLLSRPYQLSHEAAHFCIHNGIGYVSFDRPSRRDVDTASREIE
jgi:hypothetical protein